MIKELMLDDWVNVSIEGYDNPTQIKEINSFSVKVTQDEKDYGSILIQPIPLTPEILEKNGFELRPDGWLWCKEGIEDQNYIFIQFRKGCDGIRNCEVNFIHSVRATFKQINYVHQLQHALRLCGIDKEIEL